MVVMTSLAYLGSCALSTIGFSSAGPVAGTYAATWMSASALAAGGAIAKGSTVALLQMAAMGGAPVIAAGIGAAAAATVGGAGAVGASFFLF
jgi:hypothetical protein